MITDEQLATALVAKMAGMELRKVDDNTLTQSSTGPATKIDPKNFLPGIQQHQQNQQQRMIEELNRQAMMAHPLPQQQMPVQQAPAVQTVSQPQPQTFTGQDPNQLTFDFIDEATQKKSLKQLDLIVDYLYSINNKLDKILSRDKHSVS
jgi:outer membrane protein OmpA-like peptidoglycan-associated protein